MSLIQTIGIVIGVALGGALLLGAVIIVAEKIVTSMWKN